MKLRHSKEDFTGIGGNLVLGVYKKVYDQDRAKFKSTFNLALSESCSSGCPMERPCLTLELPVPIAHIPDFKCAAPIPEFENVL